MPPPVPALAPAPDMIGLLLQRGDTALASGDIIAARMLFERAASLGSATAATRAGETYDIEFLSQSGARGFRADQSAAAGWYRRAAALGDPEARARLARIEVQPRP
jgi:TPR repeat protein